MSGGLLKTAINGDDERGVIGCLWVWNNCRDNMQTLLPRGAPLQLSDKIAGSERETELLSRTGGEK